MSNYEKMDKSWFARIKACHRRAYATCLEDFRKRHGDNWKTQMRDPDVLIRYFKELGFEIATYRYHLETGDRFRFTISGPINVQSRFVYRSTEQVNWMAIGHAFYLLDRKLYFLEREHWKAWADMTHRQESSPGRKHGIGK